MSDPVEFRLAELERRLDNVLRIGTIDAADYASVRVRVKSGDLVTGWIPWMTHRASNDCSWWAPEVGEQVLLLSPCGDPAQSVALPAIYQTMHPAPGSKQTVHRTVYKDGTKVEYDRAAGKLAVDCVNEIEIRAAARVHVHAARIDWN